MHGLPARACVSTSLIPASPSKTPTSKDFNGRFRDECLNENWFVNLWEARRIAESWRQIYNTLRPHGALGDLTPEAFALQVLKSPEKETVLAEDLQ